MAASRSTRSATVGVVEHGNSAVLVTVAADGTLLDRRRIDLTKDLPTHPHHHEGSWAVGRYLDSPWARPTTLAEAVALVERVRTSAREGADRALEALSGSLSDPVERIAIRDCPALPKTVEACIADDRAQTFAYSVMYRQALANAAGARGWSVCWYERDHVYRDAAAVLGLGELDGFLAAMGKSVGPPWQVQHKLAAAAAIAAGGHDRQSAQGS